MSHVLPRLKDSGTPFTWELHKPHAGKVEMRIVFPDGDHYTWREIEYHSRSKIASNKTLGVADVPADWRIEEYGTVTVRAGSRRASTGHSLGENPVQADVDLGNVTATATRVAVELPEDAETSTEVNWRIATQ